MSYLGKTIRVDCNEVSEILKKKYLKATGKISTGGLAGAASGAAIGAALGLFGVIPGATEFTNNIKKDYCYWVLIIC